MGHNTNGGAEAERRLQLGRIAGVLFLSGAIASAPANQLLSDPKPPDWIHVIDALGFVAGITCLLLPWRRMRDAHLHALPFIASLLVSLTLVAMKSHAGVFVSFYVLASVCTGYFFRDRLVIAVHLGTLVSMFSIASASGQSARATVCAKGYRLTTTRSIGGIPAAEIASTCAGTSRRARMPP